MFEAISQLLNYDFIYRKVFICCRGYYQNWQIFGPKFTKQNLSFITATIQGRLLFKGGN